MFSSHRRLEGAADVTDGATAVNGLAGIRPREGESVSLEGVG